MSAPRQEAWRGRGGTPHRRGEARRTRPASSGGASRPSPRRVVAVVIGPPPEARRRAHEVGLGELALLDPAEDRLGGDPVIVRDLEMADELHAPPGLAPGAFPLLVVGI